MSVSVVLRRAPFHQLLVQSINTPYIGAARNKRPAMVELLGSMVLDWISVIGL